MPRSLKGLLAVSAVALTVAGCGLGHTTRRPLKGGVVPVTVVREGLGVRVYARLTIKGRTYLFLVDSGATNTVMDTEVASALRLPRHGPEEVSHPLGCTAPVEPVLVSHWRLGPIVLPPMIVGAASVGEYNLKVDDMPVAGLLGSDVLEQFGKATFEFGRHRLILGSGAPVRGHAEKLSVLHNESFGYAELVRVEIHGAPASLLVDTGASISGIDGRLAQRLKLSRLGHAGKVSGATGCTEQVHPVAIRHWRLGHLSLPSTYAVAGAMSFRYGPVVARGLFGADILSTFRRVTFEFAPRQLLILDQPLFPAKPVHKSAARTR
jgi:predicted aspartyl protease